MFCENYKQGFFDLKTLFMQNLTYVIWLFNWNTENMVMNGNLAFEGQ